MNGMTEAGITIVDLEERYRTQGLMAQIDAIFFQASGRSFEPGAERDAFRERWLGCYLEHDRQHVVVEQTLFAWIGLDARDMADDAAALCFHLEGANGKAVEVIVPYRRMPGNIVAFDTPQISDVQSEIFAEMM